MDALGTARLTRKLDHEDGLPVSFVNTLAQDRHGFLWIGTLGGLVRFDGEEMRPWGQDVVNGWVTSVLVGREQIVITEHDRGRVYRVIADGLERVADENGRPLANAEFGCVTGDGTIWLLRSGDILRLTAAGAERISSAAAFDGERPRRLVAHGKRQMLAATSRAIWRLDRGRPTARLHEIAGVVDMQPHPNGSLFVLQSKPPDWRLLELRADDVFEHIVSPERAIDLVLRGERVWASFSGDLAFVEPGRPAQLLGPDEGYGGTGGSMLVDEEESLWLGNFLGLFQFPEPDTELWTEKDGLPSRHTRFLARNSEGVWISTWSGLARLRETSSSAVLSLEHDAPRGRICADAWDRIWTGVGPSDRLRPAGGVVFERSGGRLIVHRYDASAASPCAPAADGTVWLAFSGFVRRTSADGGRPRAVGRLPEPLQGGAYSLMQDSNGWLWLGRDRAICRARIDELDAADPWRCEPLAAPVQVFEMVETPSGDVWAATSAGMLRRANGLWERIPGSRQLASDWMLSISASPSGGFWITGHGTLMRVRERRDLDSGWEVLERPTGWQGAPTSGAQSVMEDPDGTLWLTTSAGLVRIPARARRSRPRPPRVRLVDLRVDGERLPLDEKASLSYERNRLELHFAALSYRDRGLLRFRVRSRSGAPWTETRIPQFRFVDLPPGEYQPEVIASLDGVNWSAEPARLAFRVEPPWYRQAWALILFALLAAVLLYAAHRARLAVLLRLESQRARIAMDLHDEMGSGLGSIGILADLAGDETIGGEERRQIAERISKTTGELSSALGDIVWSLRAESSALEALASQLAERAQGMFPDETTVVSSIFPETWPDVVMSLRVRRNIQRIAIEALHNVSKHAGATHVSLGFAPDGARWRMWVEDDGRGLDPAAGREHAGLGMTSMRARASEIGAEITWSAPERGGTLVSVLFDPRAPTRFRNRSA